MSKKWKRRQIFDIDSYRIDQGRKVVVHNREKQEKGDKFVKFYVIRTICSFYFSVYLLKHTMLGKKALG